MTAGSPRLHLPEPLVDGPTVFGDAVCRSCGAPIRRRRNGLWHHTGPEAP